MLYSHATSSNQSDVQYNVTEPTWAYKTNQTIEKIILLNPRLILGESHLLNYDSTNNLITLSASFKKLLKLLVELDVLDPNALTADSLSVLNTVLQQAQGPHGGLLRKPGTERWHLEDSLPVQENRPEIEQLLAELGFISPPLPNSEMTVNHCIVFGALAERMEKRILNTLSYLSSTLKVTGHIFLLGSNRKLTSDEIGFLKGKFEALEEPQRGYWNEVFSDPEQSTEANAFSFLWECLVPKEQQIELEDKLIRIKSTRVGFSYHGQGGDRATTEVTAEDWLAFYNTEKPQAVFALAEQPFIRLLDQLRFSVISKGKKAGLQELVERINNTTFYFSSPTPSVPPLISVVFDEIARNVYRIKDTLEYLNGLSDSGDSAS